MKAFAGLALFLTLVPATLAQIRSTQYTRPALPAREVLDRLNLKLHWQRHITTDGKRDGIFSIQLAPRRIYGIEGELLKVTNIKLELLVQTRSGRIVALDAETGDQLWSVLVGKPYLVTDPVGFNDQEVVVARGVDIYGLDRTDGSVRWGPFRVAGVPSTPPVVSINAPPDLLARVAEKDRLDLRQLMFLAINSVHVQAYILPGQPNGTPKPDWRYDATAPLELAPTRLQDTLIYLSPRRLLVGLQASNGRLEGRFMADDNILVPGGSHEVDRTYYVGSRDANVYAGSVTASDIPVWRFTAGGPIIRTPFVTNEDVYIVGQGYGLYRVTRRPKTGREIAAYLIANKLATPQQIQAAENELGSDFSDPNKLLKTLESTNVLNAQQRIEASKQIGSGGRELWRNRDGDRVLAVNPKFVYVNDRQGRTLILDRKRGLKLSFLDAREYVVPVINELTDRLYLAANDGLIVCLHDKEYSSPVEMKSIYKPAELRVAREKAPTSP